MRTEDFASVLLQFADSARGNLAVSQVAAGRENCIRIELYGPTKSAWWWSEEPETLHLGNRPGANERPVRATPAFIAIACCARQIGAVVLTFNRHFHHIPGVRAVSRLDV